jgi:hypothetical protein
MLCDLQDDWILRRNLINKIARQVAEGDTVQLSRIAAKGEIVLTFLV